MVRIFEVLLFFCLYPFIHPCIPEMFIKYLLFSRACTKVLEIEQWANPDITPAPGGFQSIGNDRCQSEDHVNTLKYISEEVGGRRMWCFEVRGQWLVLVSCVYVLTLLVLLSLSIMIMTLQMRKQRHENITHFRGTGAKVKAGHFDSGMLVLNPYILGVEPWESRRVFMLKWQLSHDLKDKLELIR